MQRIRILPDQVANQIAAGEVIERPASVLKELLENSIDAQATSIRIEIRGGGKSLIRVSDNGHGMGRDDALLCLERHATSKIFESADIGEIRTLGFRGEAIPSIASVSRFRILTRESNDSFGTEIDVHGGKLLSVKEAGCAAGTQVEVRNLFYNLPARRKFLRSDPTELGHLQHMFLVHAIAHPHIAWTVQHESRITHELASSQPSASNPSSQILLNRVRSLHGPQLASQLVPINFKREGVQIHGLIGKPGLSRSNRSELYCFVNSRPVDSRAIYYGLIEGYHNAMMKGRYPVCFLFLEIDPAAVDVNIHPSKREVRFREDARVQGIVIEAVRRALGTQESLGRSQSPLEMTLSARPGYSGNMAHIPRFAPTTHPYSGKGEVSPSAQPSIPNFPESGAKISSFKTAISTPSPSTLPQSSPSMVAPPTILGVFDNLYVVAMDSEGLMIVDQHAAHERILFEQMMSQLSKGSAPSQKLLLLQTIELPPKDSLELKSHLSVLEKMGFGIAEFGDRSFIVDSIPPFVKFDNISQLIRSILDELHEAGRGINRDRFAEETVAKTVCRHAVKANDLLRSEELERMLLDLKACNNPFTCPHGRPTMLRLTRSELDRKFGRRP